MRAAAAIAAIALLAAASPAWTQDNRAQLPPLRLVGFTDVRYLMTERDAQGGFHQGELVGQLLAGLGGRLTFSGEIALTAEPVGFALALEQAVVHYELRDEIGLVAGRFHTPLGYWTAVSHHGAWLQTTVARPAMFDTRSGLLPAHSLGLLARGSLPIPGVELRYAAGLANGRDGDMVGPGDAGDVNGHRAWIFALDSRPAVLGGWRVGGSLYYDRLTPAPDTEVGERIATLHLASERETPELIVEYARIAHDPAERLREATTGRAFYAQLAYRLPGFARLKPYLRLEQVDVAAADSLLAPRELDYSAAILGFRYDVATFAALKAEYRSERYAEPDRFGSLHLQASLALAAPQRAEPVIASAPPPPETAEPPPPPAKSVAPAESVPAPRSAENTRAGSERIEPIAIVVHPEASVTDLTLPELRRVFRGEQEFWANQERIVLLVRSPAADERRVVLQQIYQMDEAAFRYYWTAKVFRAGVNFGPKVVSDVDVARALLVRLPGAISYMPASLVGADLRVIRINGKLPGESGYPLQ